MGHGSWDRAPHQALHSVGNLLEILSLPLPLPLPLLVLSPLFLFQNKYNKIYKKREREREETDPGAQRGSREIHKGVLKASSERRCAWEAGSSGGGEKWSYFGHIVEREQDLLLE